mgnify:CR=1 FL=1
MSDFRTPIKNARGLGSAKTGTEHFVHQRLTAITVALQRNRAARPRWSR